MAPKRDPREYTPPDETPARPGKPDPPALPRDLYDPEYEAWLDELAEESRRRWLAERDEAERPPKP